MTDPQKKFYDRETRMQTFRWATPVGLVILSAVIGFVGWVGADYLTQIRNAIVEVKSDSNAHYDKIWQAITASKDQVDCIQNQLAKCCKDSNYCA